MSMSPQELERMNKLEQLVMSILRAENVSFIESIKRRGSGDIQLVDGASATGTTTNVRNAADDGSTTVADEYAGVMTLIDNDGNTYRVGYY
jgi:hypothetical protein